MRRVVDLEEEFEDLAEADFGRIEDDLDRFGMSSMVAVGGVAHIAAGIADAGRNDALIAANEVLHAPETAAGQHRAFFAHRISLQFGCEKPCAFTTAGAKTIGANIGALT